RYMAPRLKSAMRPRHTPLAAARAGLLICVPWRCNVTSRPPAKDPGYADRYMRTRILGALHVLLGAAIGSSACAPPVLAGQAPARPGCPPPSRRGGRRLAAVRAARACGQGGAVGVGARPGAAHREPGVRRLDARAGRARGQ